MVGAELNQRIYGGAWICLARKDFATATPWWCPPRQGIGAGPSSWRYLCAAAPNTIEGGTSEVMRNILGERCWACRVTCADAGIPWKEIPWLRKRAEYRFTEEQQQLRAPQCTKFCADNFGETVSAPDESDVTFRRQGVEPVGLRARRAGSLSVPEGRRRGGRFVGRSGGGRREFRCGLRPAVRHGVPGHHFWWPARREARDALLGELVGPHRRVRRRRFGRRLRCAAAVAVAAGPGGLTSTVPRVVDAGRRGRTVGRGGRPGRLGLYAVDAGGARSTANRWSPST